VEQTNGGGTIARMQAVLLARHFVVNVITSAVFSFIESESFSHNCVYSDEVTTVDLDSGREQVGVTQGRPELNPAGTSAGTRLWKFPKPYSSNWLGLEAEVGIGRFRRRFQIKNAHFHGLIKLTLRLPELTLSLHRC